VRNGLETRGLLGASSGRTRGLTQRTLRGTEFTENGTAQSTDGTQEFAEEGGKER